MESAKDFELFCKNPLFNGLDQEQIRALFSLSEEVALKEGDYLMKEGDKAEEIFFIMEGSLEVNKYDEQFHQTHIIDTLGSGDTVGELVLLEQTQRSASVRALAPSRLRVFNAGQFVEFLKTHKEFNSIYYQFLRKLTQRLHHTTGVAFNAMQEQLKEYKTRSELGLLLVLVVSAICLFTFTLGELKYLLTIVSNSLFVSLPVTIFILLFLFFSAYFSSLTLSDIGITTKNWKRAAVDGFLLILPILAISVLIKLWAIHSWSGYIGAPLFDPYNVMTNPADRTISMWLIFNFLYAFTAAPLQELIVRGVLQGLFERLLITKYKVLVSIVFSNVIFATFHLYFSVPVGIIALFCGMWLGWIYSRTHNLLSSWIAHSIGGTWAFCILGVLPPGTG